jgi:hypothetical protein
MAYGTIRADIIEGTNVSIDLSVAGQYDFAGDLLPDTDSARDLGSNAVRWQAVYADDVYTGDLHLKNDKGDWTMIEAEDYLTLRNNKTGKTFRLLMEEVDS